MSSRHPSRYDEQTRRSGEPRDTRNPREPRETRDPRDTRETREPRDPREIVSPRDAREIVSPRDGPRDAREIVSPRDPRDTRVDLRAEQRSDPSRIEPRRDARPEPRMDTRPDPRADPRFLTRGDPRGDPRGELRGEPRPDPRDSRIDPREMRDPRDMPDYRGEPLMDPRDPRFPPTRDGRDPRDAYVRDEMEIDPPTAQRFTSYFLPGDGISREVIQADICRYLGADATCLPARNREGESGYMIRAYRMLTSKMIEDLMADSKRWDEELRRSSRTRGARPVYADTEIHERRQTTGPSLNSSGYSGSQTQMRDEDYNMDNYPHPAAPPQRTLFQSNMPQEYAQNYPMTSGAFQNPSMTAPQEYVLTRGPAGSYGQVPRSEYEMYAASTGRGATLQSPNQGQFAAQQGLPGPIPYQDPRTGQMIYPPSSAGRGFDQPPRHTNSADGRRR